MARQTFLIENIHLYQTGIYGSPLRLRTVLREGKNLDLYFKSRHFLTWENKWILLFTMFLASQVFTKVPLFFTTF